MRIEREIDSSGVIIAIQNLLPGLSAVTRTENTALFVRAVRMPKRNHVNDIGVLWIDADSGNCLRILEPQLMPGLTCISGLVHTVALHDVAPQFCFAHPDVHGVRVRFRDRDGPY